MEAILSNSTRKQFWFETTKMLIAVKKYFIALFITIFGTLSFPIGAPEWTHLWCRIDDCKEEIIDLKSIKHYAFRFVVDLL